MSNEKGGGGGGTGPSGQPSALERYLAKQKEAKAKRGLDERPKSGAASSEERAGVRSKFKRTPDPMSIARPSEPSRPVDSSKQEEQPSSLSRWEKFAGEESDPLKAKTDEPSNANADKESWSTTRFASADFQRAPKLDNNSAQDFGANPELEAAPTGTLRPTPEIGTRLLAAIIDGIIVSCLTIPATKATSALLSVAFGPVVDRHGDGLDTVASFLVIYFYYSYFYSKKGASPGKLLFNIEVIDAETGRYLTPWKAFFREAIGKFISLVPFGMGYVIAAFRQDRRALHDLLFDTNVVLKK